MHLIYSALRADGEPNNDRPQNTPEIYLRHLAYLSACDKHQELIKEIQKYFPNWTPPFR